MKVKIVRVLPELNRVEATVSHKGIIADVSVALHSPTFLRLTLNQRLTAAFYERLELVVEDLMMEALQKVKSNRA